MDLKDASSLNQFEENLKEVSEQGFRKNHECFSGRSYSAKNYLNRFTLMSCFIKLKHMKTYWYECSSIQKVRGTYI